MRLVLAGFGVIGQSFAELLLAKGKELAIDYGIVPQVVGVADSSGFAADEHGLDLVKLLREKREKGRVGGKKRERTTSEVIREMEAEVLIEATSTNIRSGEPALSHIRAAFESRKHVVTCNKGPVAVAFRALHELARHNGVQLRYSGSVGGGTPILAFGKTCAQGDDLVGMRGILNGTCNFILSKMEEESVPFKDALKEAQRLGYAETDPTLDVEGHDSAVKLVIAANHLMLSKAGIPDVRVKGITGVTLDELARAKKQGKAIRLLASAAADRLTVEPAVIERTDPLCITGAFNAVRFECRYSGPKVIVGKGAGGPETASSLLRDLIDIRGMINGVEH